MDTFDLNQLLIMNFYLQTCNVAAHECCKEVHLFLHQDMEDNYISLTVIILFVYFCCSCLFDIHISD